ncbi:MAG TPA: 3-hydroxyacyl-CoA dehydrogenase family protein [Holophagaceae bacterium]|nr:3-hydroxyacyl-CoA dehydrogenase family protein [Holophagaceae bacterium]
MTEVLGILGPGVLGLSLAQWAAEQGLQVRLMGRDRAHAERGLIELNHRWEVLTRKGKVLPEARETFTHRVRPLAPGQWEDCTALLEATPEDPHLKARVWESLRGNLPPHLLCLTGSSALPVGTLARAAGLEGRLLGFHLFVPVRSMRVVELVAPSDNASEPIARARSLAERLGLRVAQVRDGAGYAAARMSLALGLEAIRLLEEGVASAEDLDVLMKLGYGHPRGPLELSDQVGLDLRLAIADRLREAHGDRFEAPELLRRRVGQGMLGQKTGQGLQAQLPEKP